MMTEFSACPKCGGEVECGFGLAGGGYGPYVYCIGTTLTDECDWFYKEAEPKENAE